VTSSRREDLAVKTGLKVLVLRPQFPAGCGAGTSGSCDAMVGILGMQIVFQSPTE
jgi:hypothetical protein